MENFVKIKGPDNEVKLKSVKNQLNVKSVKLYFSEAVGLTYKDEEGEQIGVEIIDDQFILNPDVEVYNVYCTSPAKSKYIYLFTYV